MDFVKRLNSREVRKYVRNILMGIKAELEQEKTDGQMLKKINARLSKNLK